MDTRLEGAYEQFDKRLGAIETRMTGLEHRVDARSDGIERRIDAVAGGLRSEFGELRGEFGGLRGELGGLRSELIQKFDLLTAQLISTVRWGASLLLMSWLSLMLAIFLHH